MFKYQALIKDNMKDIARLITIEQGKTLPDADGDVMRGLQVLKLNKREIDGIWLLYKRFFSPFHRL